MTTGAARLVVVLPARQRHQQTPGRICCTATAAAGRRSGCRLRLFPDAITQDGAAATVRGGRCGTVEAACAEQKLAELMGQVGVGGPCLVDI